MCALLVCVSLKTMCVIGGVGVLVVAGVFVCVWCCLFVCSMLGVLALFAFASLGWFTLSVLVFLCNVICLRCSSVFFFFMYFVCVVGYGCVCFCVC